MPCTYFDNLHWLVTTTLTSIRHASLSLFSVFTVSVSVARTRIHPASIDLQLCNSVVPGCCQGKALLPPSVVAVVASWGKGGESSPPHPTSGTLFKGNKIHIWKRRNDRWHATGLVEYSVFTSSKGGHGHFFG
jgi:hypothetical protein